MKKFSELGVKSEIKGFSGDKIKMDRVLNRLICVHDFKIEDSKFKDKGNGKCLYLQIEIDNERRVLFTGSVIMMDMVQKVAKSDFPFSTTIAKLNDRFEFT